MTPSTRITWPCLGITMMTSNRQPTSWTASQWTSAKRTTLARPKTTPWRLSPTCQACLLSLAANATTTFRPSLSTQRCTETSSLKSVRTRKSSTHCLTYRLRTQASSKLARHRRRPPMLIKNETRIQVSAQPTLTNCRPICAKLICSEMCFPLSIKWSIRRWEL